MKEVMTLKKFKRAIEDWGVIYDLEASVEIKNLETIVWGKDRHWPKAKQLAVIGNSEPYLLCIGHEPEYKNLNGLARQFLFEIVASYAATDPSDRKTEEKKFFLKHKWLAGDIFPFLNFVIDRHGCQFYTLAGKDEFDSKTKFTLDEIEEIKKVYVTDLSDFELIEVEKDA